MGKNPRAVIAGPSGRSLLTAFAAFWLVISCASITAQKLQPRSRGKLSSDRLSALAHKAVSEGDRLRAAWTRDSLEMAAKKYAEAQFFWHISNYPRREAEVLKKLGDTHSILSDYQGAIDDYNGALALAISVSDQRFEVDVLTQLSAAYLEMANVRKAFPFCSKAQEISLRIGYQEGMAQALNCLGVINSISSEVLQAQQSFEKAQSIWQMARSEQGLALAHLNLGYLHSNLGNMELSLDFYKRALVAWQAANDHQKQALTLTAMGGVYALQGEKQTAMNVHNQALRLLRTIGNRNGEAATLNGIGYLYDDLGEKTKALKSYTDALQLYEAIGNQHYAAITRGYIGRVHFALGDNDKALEFHKDKLATTRAVQDWRMESYTLKDIGNVLSATNKKDQALENYRQALALSQKVMDRRGGAYILLSIGSIHEEQGGKSTALSYYEQALPLMQAVADRRGEVLTLYSIARAERDLGRLREARGNMERSIALIEKLRMKVVSPSLRISYLETVYKHYELYVDLLMQMHRLNPGAGYEVLAFEVNDNARARTLLENLMTGHTDIRQGVDPTLLAEERGLQQRLNQKAEQQTRLLSGKSTPEQAAGINKEVEHLLTQYQEIESRVRDESPKYAALTQPQRLKLSDIQNELDHETLLLEYSLGVDRSYVWAVTPTSVSSFELPGSAEIEAAARDLYKILAASNARRKNESRAEQQARIAQAAAAYPAAAEKLGRIVLAPIASQLGRKRLLLVVDGVLQYIPFAVLPEPGQSRLPDGSAPPLVANHEVIMLPSLSTLVALRNEVRGRVPARKAVAVLADPVFERDDPRLRARQPGVRLRRGSRASSEVQARRRQRGLATIEVEPGNEVATFERLPFSFQEAQAIFEIAPSDTRRAIAFDANLKTVLDPELRQYRIIHFATHALLNNSNPELSGIVLSLLDPAGRPRDGFLRLNEIYNMNLPAELVVLSACQTALGKEARGEGLIGLTRGFMYAGVPRVIATLWRINDRAAAELMRYFYEAMFRQHLPPAKALRAAQIKMWQTEEWRFPYYWGAFVLQGEWK